MISEVIFCVIGGLLLIAAIFAAVMGFCFFMGSLECESISKAQGIETKFDGFNCYRKIGDKWLTGSQYNMYIINNVK